MKRNLEIKSIQELEQELYIIQKCEIIADAEWNVQDALNGISREIEGSIADEEVVSNQSWAKKLLSKFLFKRAISNKNFSLTKMGAIEAEDPNDSQIRLRTAITAFKLHSGPFALHPKYGKLNKSDWEKWIGYISTISLGNLKIVGDEGLRKAQEDRKIQKEKKHSNHSLENNRKNKKKHFRKHHHKNKGHKR
jgi:hypothetical protein